MRRVVVLGGSGFFGARVIEKLREAGVAPIAASRSAGELRIDANNPGASLRAGDLVIDAAGPFQTRTPALIDAAIENRFDVIDLSDSVAYTSMIYAREAAIAAAGIRVLTACSALSTVSAAVIAANGIQTPSRITAYLVPASRFTANPATIASILHSVIGDRRRIAFPPPLRSRAGITVQSVDGVTLPRVFPSLHTTEFVVNAGMNALFQCIARSAVLRGIVRRAQPLALAITRRVGKREGVLAYEIQSERGLTHQMFLGARSYMLAVLPAVRAAIGMLAGKLPPAGIVAPPDHVAADDLFAAARAEGVAIR